MITENPIWKTLQDHFEQVSDVRMRDLFDADPKRFEKFSCEHEGLLLDYSKNRITDATFELLIKLARAADVESWRRRLFSGEAGSSLHTVLRDDGHGPAAAAGKTDAALADKRRMYELCEALRAGRIAGFGGKPIRDIVNIGIGGSHLGPAMSCHALSHLAHEDIRVFFVSNVDASQMSAVLGKINPEHALFVVTSKAFATQETLINAGCARRWINRHYGADNAWHKHFLAITANPAAAERFGVPADRVLPLWDSISGRFSLWSAAGLPLAVLIGDERFEELLAGARSMDAHFAQAPLASNMPVILAMLDIWYVNFFGVGSRAVLPYDYALERLPEYLQQLEMESNGKSVSRDGRALPYATAPVIWGKSGLEGQHAFYQLLHQGGRLVPSDFIVTARGVEEMKPNDEIVRANFLAQTHALMYGAADAGNGSGQYPGNQPSNALVLDALSPFTLGLLLALYEHKVFVQATVWGINPFDQPGVELGKRIAGDLLNDGVVLDGSTRGLMARLRR